MRKILLLSISILFFFNINAQQKQALIENSDKNTLLWEVSGKGLSRSSYLFGTFHLMCKEDIQFSSQLKKSLEAADEMYMELDMDDPSMLFGGLLMMNMKGGKKLKDLLPEKDYLRVSNFFKDSLKLPFAMMEGMKPYMLVAMLYPKMMPCKVTSGVEEELMRLAKLNKKEIKGLETMAFQSAVFDSIPYEQQAKELLKSIDSIDTYKIYFDSMMRVYKSQQLDKIETLFNDKEFGMEEYQDVLLDNRNKNWVQKLNAIMNKESVFVAVGAGHLPGKNGLIALLQKEGYTVKPLANK
ncbi:MAG: TraB/GumN family protein [Ferruginibacter sp.]